MEKYVVYLTTYSGEKMPPYYIGSTSLSNIKNHGYKGSVSSKQWKLIFKEELKNNPHLFSVSILSVHETRKEALDKELQIQIEKDVVGNELFINKSLAKPNGYFGMSGPRLPLSKSQKHELTNFCWITNETINLKLHKLKQKDELESYLANGWRMGKKNLTELEKVHLYGPHPEWRKKLLRKPKSKEHVNKIAEKHKKQIVIFGILYNSQREASEALGKSRSYFMKRINDPKQTDCYIP